MARDASTVEITPEQNLSRYLQKARSYPMLDADEEVALARRWREKKDKQAADRLVGSHLRLVVKIAMGFRGYGLPVADLISEGNVGMMQAINRFDPDRGFRLSTYAMWWIRASIHEYILHSWSLVKIGTTASQKKLFFNLRKLKSSLQALDSGDLTPENVSAIATHLKVPEKDVVSMNRRLSGPDHSLNTPVNEDGEGEWIDWIQDTQDNQETRIGHGEEMSWRHTLLVGAMDRLSERERHIIVERRLKDSPATLQDLSLEYGISRERVRQIEVRAFEKLQKSVKNAAIQQQYVC
jgi:RNA polymerase sigma-32 factor